MTSVDDPAVYICPAPVEEVEGGGQPVEDVVPFDGTVCSIMMHAMLKPVHTYSDGYQWVGNTMHVSSELSQYIDVTKNVLLIPSTCNDFNICTWNVLLQDQACQLARSSPHYIDGVFANVLAKTGEYENAMVYLHPKNMDHNSVGGPDE